MPEIRKGGTEDGGRRVTTATPVRSPLFTLNSASSSFYLFLKGLFSENDDDFLDGYCSVFGFLVFGLTVFSMRLGFLVDEFRLGFGE